MISMLKESSSHCAITQPAGWLRGESVFSPFFYFFTYFRSLRPGP